jgi:hypothetical protein
MSNDSSAALLVGLTIAILLPLPLVSSRLQRLSGRVPRSRRLMRLSLAHPGPMILAVVLVPSASIFAGAALCVLVGRSFERFGALDLVPGILALMISREAAAKWAGIFAAILSIIALDGAGRSDPPDESDNFWWFLRYAWIAPFAYVPAVELLSTGALLGWRFSYGRPLVSFFRRASEMAGWRDLLVGLCTTFGIAVVLTIVFHVGRRFWLSPKHSLGSKLWAAVGVFVALHGVGLAIGAASS